MFGITNKIRSTLGLLKFEQVTDKDSNVIIKISGINSRYLELDLKRIFSTSRVYSAVFDNVSRYALVFPAFFALEVEKIMLMIIDSPLRLNTSRRTARMILDGLYEFTWLARTKIEDYPKRLDQSKLKYFSFKPLPFQQTFIDMFDRVTYQYSLNGVLLDAIMGSGKTITSLYISECAQKDIKVIVSPNNALENVWVKTIRNDINRPIKYWTTKSGLPYKGEEYILIHYEGLRKGIEALSGIRNKTFSLVIDECHNFAEIKSQQTQNLIALQKLIKAKVVVPQSGTTFKAIGSEIVSMMFLLDDMFTEDIAKRFSRMYGASATEALKLLQHRMGFITHKVTKQDVGLPEPIIKNFNVVSSKGKDYTLPVVKAEMEAFVKERLLYYKSREKQDTKDYFYCLEIYEKSLSNKAEKAEYEKYKIAVKTIRSRKAKDCPDEIVFSNYFEKKYILPKLNKSQVELFKEVKTIYKYVELKVNGECLGRVLAKKRKECAMEIARNIPYQTFIESTEKKTMVYTVYVDTLKTVKDTLEYQGYKVLIVYGDTNKDLTKIIDMFENDQSYNPLIATYKSLSTAVPMTMADVMVMVDTPFRDYIFQQTLARINRLGTTTQTYVYIANLDTGSEANLSTRTLDILKWSQSQIEAISGVKSPFEITDEQMSLESNAADGVELFLDINTEELYLNKLV